MEKKDDVSPFQSGDEVCPLIGMLKDTVEPYEITNTWVKI